MRKVSRRVVLRGFICLLLLSGMMVVFSCMKSQFNSGQSQQSTSSYTIQQTLSDGAQQNTIAFDALGFMTGNLGSQTFLPPGKVADYAGFQYLRDNDPTGLGHNTSFVTIVAYNVLHILNSSQIQLFINAANTQISLLNIYAYKRFPLCKAFRRLLENDLPAGKTELDSSAVIEYSANLYKIDGEISYRRAQVYGQVIKSLSTQQISQFNALKALNGVAHWDSTLQNPLQSYNLSQDVNIAVMTYASEIYSWYTGSVNADVYFCPERQGTYFGSFYLKDWPAMGNPNFTINSQLTANAGQDFLNVLTAPQSSRITGLVSLQKGSLYALVGARQDISVELRKFLSRSVADSSKIYSLSEDYGRDDGRIIYLFATYFSNVYQSLTQQQKDQLKTLADDLGYIDPSGAFLYSSPIAMPDIENTDFFFK
ncbi:MAG: hypothetical protein ABSD71_13985 [Bacteroidales bacterium]